MFEELKELLNNSYAKYSNYRVSAILVTNELKKYKGVNIENASYGATVCAERSAIFSAISNGERNFKELNIMVDSDLTAIPCYLCRQVFSELLSPEMDVNCYNKNGDKKTYKIKELCVLPFNGDNLV